MTSELCRVEHDSLGEVEVPADRLWGAQTERSRRNFPIGVECFRWGRSVIRAFGILQKCAALSAEQNLIPAVTDFATGSPSKPSNSITLLSSDGLICRTRLRSLSGRQFQAGLRDSIGLSATLRTLFDHARQNQTNPMRGSRSRFSAKITPLPSPVRRATFSQMSSSL